MLPYHFTDARFTTVFEDKALADQAVNAVEKVVAHHEEAPLSKKSTEVDVKKLDI